MEKPSEMIRNLISEIIPQNEEDFEKSNFPIYTDYSFQFDDINDKRIIVYQGKTNPPVAFVGDEQMMRLLSCDVVVASADFNESYTISNAIFNYLRKIKGNYGIIRIEASSDIEFLGINAKRLCLYSCSYAIIKENN